MISYYFKHNSSFYHKLCFKLYMTFSKSYYDENSSGEVSTPISILFLKHHIVHLLTKYSTAGHMVVAR